MKSVRFLIRTMQTVRFQERLGITRSNLVRNLMKAAMSQTRSPERAYHRICRLARTIAALAGCEESWLVHLAEAPTYRVRIMMI